MAAAAATTTSSSTSPSSSSSSSPSTSTPLTTRIALFFPLTGCDVNHPSTAVVNATISDAVAAMTSSSSTTTTTSSSVVVLSRLYDACDDDSSLAAFTDIFRQSQGIRIPPPPASLATVRTSLVVGPSVEDLCNIVGRMAAVQGVTIVAWNCDSQNVFDRRTFATMLRAVPLSTAVTAALQAVLVHFRWRYVVLVASDAAAEYIDMATEIDLNLSMNKTIEVLDLVFLSGDDQTYNGFVHAASPDMGTAKGFRLF